MNLEEFQRRFQASLLVDRAEDSVSLAAAMMPESSHRGLDVHRRNLVFGVVSVLKHRFPRCVRVLGQANFRFFARQYALTQPPRGRELASIASGFADFLRDRPELAELEEISAIARGELRG